MNNNFISIYTTNFGTEVYMGVVHDVSSKRLSMKFMIKTQDGSFSDIISVKRSDFITNKNALKFLLDFDADFGRDEVMAIKSIVAQSMANEEYSKIYIKEKTTIQEKYKKLVQYINEEKEDIKMNPEAKIFIKDEDGFIETKYMDEVLKDIFDNETYKRNNILYNLKVIEVLKPGKNRIYDTAVKINGVIKHYYKIKLYVLESSEEAVDEIIEIEEIKGE